MWLLIKAFLTIDLTDLQTHTTVRTWYGGGGLYFSTYSQLSLAAQKFFQIGTTLWSCGCQKYPEQIILFYVIFAILVHFLNACLH